MNSRRDSRLTSVVFSSVASLRSLDVCKVGFGHSISEHGAMGFVNVTAITQSSTAALAMLILQSVQFMTATGLCKWARWDSALDASASRDHFAILQWTGAILFACSSISLSPIWALCFLSGLRQT